MLLDLFHWLHNNMIVVMMAIFIAIAAYAYWPGNRRHIEANGRIPLRDDNP